jgi:hypothetical protein
MRILIMRYKIIISIFLFIAWNGNPIVIYAQVIEEWVVRYNAFNGYFDAAYATAIDSSGYIYVTGGSIEDTIASTDCTTIKYDSGGNQVWEARYNGSMNEGEVGLDLVVDVLGNVYVTGRSVKNGSDYDPDYLTLKYNNAGSVLWSAKYNGPGDSIDIPSDLVVDAFGNVYVTGRSWGHPDSFSDFDWATIKYDSMGNELWVRRYNGLGNYNDYAYALAVDQTGNVYVSGMSAALSLAFELTTIKYDTGGNEEWVVRDDSVSGGRDIVLDTSGNLLIPGERWVSSFSDAAVIKYDSNGTLINLFQYDSGSNSEGTSYIALDQWGNIIIAGVNDGGLINTDYLTVKFDTAGNFLWSNIWNGPADDKDFISGLAVDPMGNVAVTGITETGPSWLSNYATVKYDSSGNQLWDTLYNGPADFDDESNGIVMDASGNVYVTGFSDAGPPTGYDYTTIKYSDLTGVEENKDIRIVKPDHFSISPNPFWSVTTIQGRGEFKVYDLMGRLRGRVKKGSFGRDLPAGVYIIQQGEKKKKIVKIK